MEEMQIIESICAEDVVEEPIKYLWHPYLYDNNVNIVGGEAGTGKTWFLCALMAAVSKGYSEGMPGSVRRKGKVIYAGGEDGNAVMRHRLVNVGADLKQIILIEKTFNAFGDAFREMVKKLKPALIVFDPLLSYIPEKWDPNRYTTAKSLMDDLREFAREMDTSIVCVIHPPKKDEYRLIHRFTGSGGFVDAARSVTYIGYHPDDPDKRVVIQCKNSFGYSAPCTFGIDRNLGFVWGEEDKGITMRDVEQSHKTSSTGDDSPINTYCLVVENVLKMHPEGVSMTAKQMLEEYGKLTAHNITASAFGQMLGKGEMQRRLMKSGIILEKGAKTANRQKYNVRRDEKWQKED